MFLDENFVICVIAASCYVQIFVFDKENNFEKLSVKYDLNDCYHRLKLLINMLNLACILPGKNQKHCKFQTLAWLGKSNGVKMYFDFDFIIKQIKLNESNLSKSDVKVLKQIYAEINEKKYHLQLNIKFCHLKMKY